MSGGWYWGQKRCIGKLWYTLGIVFIFVFIKSGHMRSNQIPHITNNLRILTPTKNDPRFLLRSTKYPEELVQILRSPKPSSRLKMRLFGTRGTVRNSIGSHRRSSSVPANSLGRSRPSLGLRAFLAILPFHETTQAQ
jgi:hypothetical protein